VETTRRVSGVTVKVLKVRDSTTQSGAKGTSQLSFSAIQKKRAMTVGRG
jgi:hypothetical protein